MWVYKFEAEPHSRVDRYISVVAKEKGTRIAVWWSYKLNKFVDEIHGYGDHSTEGKYIKSFKAFKRFLRKNPYLQKYDIELWGRYDTIYARWINLEERMNDTRS